MKVKIFRPAKSAMQSGKKSRKWLLLPIEETNVRSINPLLGWVSVGNSLSQLRFEFLSKEEAVEFAKSRNFEFEIEEPKIALVKRKSYAENFLSDV